MHHRVDDALAQDALRNQRPIGALRVALGQAERFGQIIKHRGECAPDGAKQVITDLDGIEAPIRVRDPFLAGHSHVVDARHRVNAAQRPCLAEEQ